MGSGDGLDPMKETMMDLAVPRPRNNQGLQLLTMARLAKLWLNLGQPEEVHTLLDQMEDLAVEMTRPRHRAAERFIDLRSA